MEATPESGLMYRLGYRLAYALMLPLCRPQITGTEHVPKSGPFLAAANHTSYLDPILIGCVFPRELNYMAKETLFRAPADWLLRSVNAFPVKRWSADVGALRHALRVLKEDRPVLLFPEGTRGTGAEFLAARKGVGFLAVRSQAPVIPVYVDGASTVLGRGQTYPRRAQVRISVGPAMSFPRDTEPEVAAYDILAAIGELRESFRQQHSS
ncbi:1-acyl-sn-glycerol-3-phosphate acyltransferase [Candidatus Poribacteria bacterium]|nr:1-acyl-sn-glycerol-3-phosphate acyltransferase [Candidatus Poribacteria bacterium]